MFSHWEDVATVCAKTTYRIPTKLWSISLEVKPCGENCSDVGVEHWNIEETLVSELLEKSMKMQVQTFPLIFRTFQVVKSFSDVKNISEMHATCFGADEANVS